jgi:hypothetical protein
MSKRALTVSILTAGLSAGLLAGALSPAAAQGNPVGGQGNLYFLSGAMNTDGKAQKITAFGDPGDEVYFGDWYGSGEDMPMVRRGNVFFVPNDANQNITQRIFAYGDAGDSVLIGDWNGDGVDTIAIRRGNTFHVKNDNKSTGTADSKFVYGDTGDTILVGDWDGPGSGTVRATDGPSAGSNVPDAGTDTLMVQRGNKFFVKNDIETGDAEYTFLFGDAQDEGNVLVGDWASAGKADAASTKDKNEYVAPSDSDDRDQLAVRRGIIYHKSAELEDAREAGENPKTIEQLAYGDVSDTVFVASLESEAQAQHVIEATGSAKLEIGAAPLSGASTAADVAAALVYDKNGVPMVAEYAVAANGVVTKPAKAKAGTGGGVYEVFTAAGKKITLTLAAGAEFKDASGGYVFDADGVPYLATVAGTNDAPLAPGGFAAKLLADDYTNVPENGTSAFTKEGKPATYDLPISGDGLGVRR